MKKIKGKICPHCGGDTHIRKPVEDSGCDHVYYPDYCNICKARENPCVHLWAVRDRVEYGPVQRVTTYFCRYCLEVKKVSDE